VGRDGASVVVIQCVGHVVMHRELVQWTLGPAFHSNHRGSGVPQLVIIASIESPSAVPYCLFVICTPWTVSAPLAVTAAVTQHLQVPIRL
jgi:hypothetical protein